MPPIPATESLQHAERLTSHRDHAMLDCGLVSSLTSMLGRGRRRVNVQLYRTDIDDELLHITQTASCNGVEQDHNEYLCEPETLPEAMQRAISLHVFHTEIQQEGRRSMHCCWFPVVADNRLLACIEIRCSRALSMRQLQMIHGMLGLYRNYLQLLNYSQHDSLTGLLNRKTFDDSLERILLNTPLLPPRDNEQRHPEDSVGNSWLAILDIDHFKRINDQYGHLFGDEVLIQVARLMRRLCRRTDKLFRFGGEEFVIVIQQIGENDVARLLERLRATVEQNPIPQVGQITLSIGYTQLHPDDQASVALGRADHALYHGKQHGRNQVNRYETLLAQGEVCTPLLHDDVTLF
ncbi:GGDEF domain-containing protein [Dechloromonas sp. ZY10]|uniref:GGDEF domain-containing protein n=1 Tax=Dechloromonas aquae TaxID=2664436 RepID=UPI003527383A